MKRCIQLAKNGLGTTYPNPLVGSVIVHNNKIIGEGWHYKAGSPHAEVHAIASVKETALLKDATIYVSLEPCSHFGKTPPCADLIISKGIKSVVIGTTDPNLKVAGKGIKKLRDAGCDVITKVLEIECKELNKRFFIFQQKKRPFILLKWAETTDGFIAPKTREQQKPVWITNAYSRQLAHKLRAQEQAILVGTQTVVDDNPSLTTRHWFGESPTRVIVDRNLRIEPNSTIYNNKVTTYILSDTKGEGKGFIQTTIDFSKELPSQICDFLYNKGFQSVIIEGGAKTIQTFLDANLWDEAYVFKGKNCFGEGVKAPKMKGLLISERQIKSDILFHYKNTLH